MYRPCALLCSLTAFLLILCCAALGEDSAVKASSGEMSPKELSELLQKGDVEELRAECRIRGIPDDGDEITLKRRLLDHQRRLDSVPFDDLVQNLAGKDIVLRHADFIEYSEDAKGNGIVWLRGNVDMTYEGKEISADEVNVNMATRIVTGSGNITFTDGAKQYHARSFFYNANSNEGVFFSARTTLGKFHYRGETIEKLREGEKFVGGTVSLTTCDLENPHYRVEADRLHFYDGDRVLITNATFYYGNEPVLRLPYVYRSLRDKAIKTAVLVRQRSGVAVQNTYNAVDTDSRQLVLKGDFYSRLGIYAGVDYNTRSEKYESKLWASSALSNDVYYYDNVTKNWSPLGPPTAADKDINRSFRYRAGFSQWYRFGTTYDNVLEANLEWISDPYYEHDFERRLDYFDIFTIIGQAEYDDPRKGEGFDWILNDTFLYRSLSISLKNKVRFEPQLNSSEPFPELPDYYNYRIYTLAAPDIAVTHTERLFVDSPSAVFSGIDYASSGSYKYNIYYDPTGKPSSEVHGAETSVAFTKEYTLSRLVRFTPALEAGAQGQFHAEPDGSEQLDDSQNTYIYGRTTEALKVGSQNLYVNFAYDLKYKLLGQDDLYEYGAFRVHDLFLTGYAGTSFISYNVATSYDLRPTYDWNQNRYVGTVFETNRFSPLVNTLTVTPVSVLTLSDKLVYEIAEDRFQTNTFRLNYQSNSVYLLRWELKAHWDLYWDHNFVDPFLDMFGSEFGVDAKPHPLWTFSFGVLSRNDDFWKYFKKTAGEPVNPFVDLLKSFNFFNRKDREESNFKLRGVSAGFSHDLHDWELRGGYKGYRELSYDETRYDWVNTFYVSVSLKDVKNADIHTDYTVRK